MGEQGVLYSDATGVKHVPAMKVDVVDATVCVLLGARGLQVYWNVLVPGVCPS